MLLVIGIIAAGVRRGIELSVKVMVPVIVVLLLGLAAYGFTLDGGASAAYSYYLARLRDDRGELDGDPAGRRRAGVLHPLGRDGRNDHLRLLPR